MRAGSPHGHARDQLHARPPPTAQPASDSDYSIALETCEFVGVNSDRREHLGVMLAKLGRPSHRPAVFGRVGHPGSFAALRMTQRKDDTKKWRRRAFVMRSQNPHLPAAKRP